MINCLKSITILTGIILLCGAAACTKKSTGLSKILDVEKTACACIDKTCAEEALDQYRNIIEEIQNEEFNKEDSLKLQQSSMNFMVCILKKGISAEKVKSYLQ